MLRPLPSLLPSEVYFLEDFELNLGLFLQDGVGEFGALSPTIPYLLQGPLRNAKVWLPLMWGGDSPSTGSSFRCLVVLPGYVCVWRGEDGEVLPGWGALGGLVLLSHPRRAES